MIHSLRCIVVLSLALLIGACGANSPTELIASARGYLLKADAKSAILQLKTALQKSPDNAEARFLLAQALLDVGDASGAETEVRKAIELKYAEDQAYPLLGRTLLAQRSYRKVITELDGRTIGSPAGRADLAITRALAYLAEGDIGSAERLASEAARDGPGTVRLLMTQFEIARHRNDVAAATRYLDEALTKDPGNADAIVQKAALLVAQGQGDAAIKLLEQSVAAQPNALVLRLALVPMLVTSRRTNEADAHVAKLRELAPNDLRSMYVDALWSYAKNDTLHARDLLRQVLGAVPEHLPAHLLNGMVQFKLGAYGLAEDSLRKVLARSPGEPNATRLLAATFVRTGRAQQALDVLAPLLKGASPDPFVWRTAGEAALATSDPSAATAYYERAASLDSGNVGTKVRLAQIRMAAGDTDRAFRDLNELSRADAGEAEADFALVAANLRRRHIDDALEAARTIVKKYPDKAQGYTVVGAIQLLKHDLPGARSSFEQALAREPGFVQAARNLAVIDIQEGKAAAARARYDAMLAKNPDDETLLLASAELAAVTGDDPSVARKLLDRAVAAHPTSAAPRLASISLAMRDRDAKSALSAAQAAATALPDEPRIQEALAGVQLASGDANQSIQTLQQLIKSQPRNATLLLRLAETQATANDLPGAIVSVRKAIALNPDSAPARHLLTRLQLSNRQTEQAIAEARALQTSMPTSSIGYLLEGEIRTEEGRWSNATAAYRQALARQASPAIAGRIYISLSREGKSADAAAFATQWNRQHPDDITIPVLIAEQAQARQDVATAMAQYRAALAVQPDNWKVLNNMAWALMSANDPSARQYAERAYQLAPFNASVIDTLGSVLVSSGDVARGVELLRMATNLSPQAAEIRLHLGKALAKAGDKTAARRELELLTRPDAAPRFRDDAQKALAAL